MMDTFSSIKIVKTFSKHRHRSTDTYIYFNFKLGVQKYMKYCILYQTLVSHMIWYFKDCDDGWSLRADTGECYFLDQIERYWFDASANCQDLGAELTSIHSVEENGFLLGKLWFDISSFILNLVWQMFMPVRVLTDYHMCNKKSEFFNSFDNKWNQWWS